MGKNDFKLKLSAAENFILFTLIRFREFDL
jgi:hypothetical protein